MVPTKSNLPYFRAPVSLTEKSFSRNILVTNYIISDSNIFSPRNLTRVSKTLTWSDSDHSWTSMVNREENALSAKMRFQLAVNLSQASEGLTHFHPAWLHFLLKRCLHPI